ncbi:MAG: thioesterase [Verrucomicrobia bacterium]|nr:thioesterase [Verrucomicrobiota bacterium]
MSPSNWLPLSKTLDSEKIHVYCLPHAGSGASCFVDWLTETDDSIQFIPIELPGRESRFNEKPYIEMGRLIEDLSHHLSTYMRPNSIFFGHSLGGYIAFELALRFSNQNVHLIVSGSCAPERKREKKISHLPDKEFLSEIRAYGGMPKELFGNRELIEILIQVLRSDLTLFENYHPKLDSKINGNLAAIGGMFDKLAPFEALSLWQNHTDLLFEQYVVEGGHFFHKEKPSVVKKLIETFALKAKNSHNLGGGSIV